MLYYYLVSSLPALTRDTDPLPGIESFLEAAARWMKPDDYRRLAVCRLQENTGGFHPHPVWTAWRRREGQLRLELAKMRSRRTGIGGEEYIQMPSMDVYAAEAARKAMESANPLDAEELLDSFRLILISELSRGHHFDLAALILYFLKLQILQRQRNFQFPRGRERFESIQNTILRRIEKKEKEQSASRQ